MKEQPTQLYRESSCGGTYGGFDLEINVATTKPVNLKEEKIWYAVYDAVKLLKGAILAEVIKNDPEAQERARAERERLLACFPGTPFVEEIPNGYCSDFCCKHLPWFILTTQVGRIKIGWRKRVINIDWSETPKTKTAAQLFAKEEVTKGDKYIHAWSYEDAKRYVETIINSVDAK